MTEQLRRIEHTIIVSKNEQEGVGKDRLVDRASVHLIKLLRFYSYSKYVHYITGERLMSQTLPKNTIDPSSYTSETIFSKELDQIFARSWQYVGHVCKVQNPGDYFVVDVAGESLIITRSSDNELNALFNVCAHRASRIASGEGRKTRFGCPNHAWCYDNKGELLRAVNADKVPGMNIKNYSLSRCAIEEVNGLLFVNLDSNADPIYSSVCDMVQEIQAALPQLADYQFAHRTEVTMRANWKVAVENFSECYHCPLVHKSFFSSRGSTEGGGVDADSYHIETNGIWQRHHGIAYGGTVDESGAEESEDFVVWWLWPNFAVQQHPGNMVNVRQWVPVSPDETYVYVDWFLPRDATEQDQKVFSEHASGVFAEDIPIIEWVQQGLKSRGYRGGPLMIDKEGSVLSEHGVAEIQELWKASMV